MTLNIENDGIFIRSIYDNKLYIGNYSCLSNEDILKKYNIKTIISLSKKQFEFTNDSIFIYHNKITNQFMNYNDFQLMHKIVTRSLINKKPVLLQCETGVGNSALFALFCLSTIENGLTLEQKFEWFKEKIPELQLDHTEPILKRVLSTISKLYNEFSDEKNYTLYCNQILLNIEK
jgi:hypothetical protein